MSDFHHRDRGRRLLEQAALAFQRSTGFEAKPAAPPIDGPYSQLDGMMHFDLGNGRAFSMPVEAKIRVDRFAMIPQLKSMRDSVGEQVLLVTDYLSPEMAEGLRDSGIPYVDTAGNVFLNRAEALLYVAGQREGSRASVASRGRSGSPKQLEVLHALFVRPELVNASYRAIASAARVAISTVNVAIDDFLARQLLVAGTDGKRQFGEWERVVDEWTSLYPIKLKSKLAVRRFSANNADWWQHVDIAKYGAVFSGEVAAAKLTRHLRPQRLMLYAPTTLPNDLIIEARLRADPQGEIEVFQAFWPPPNPPLQRIPADIAHPMLVYADLLDSRESRNLDIARTIREQYLGHRPQPSA